MISLAIRGNNLFILIKLVKKIIQTIILCYFLNFLWIFIIILKYVSLWFATLLAGDWVQQWHSFSLTYLHKPRTIHYPSLCSDKMLRLEMSSLKPFYGGKLMLIRSSKTKFSVEGNSWFVLQWQGNFTISSAAGSGNVILLIANKEISYFFCKVNVWPFQYWILLDNTRKCNLKKIAPPSLRDLYTVWLENETIDFWYKSNNTFNPNNNRGYKSLEPKRIEILKSYWQD